MTKRIISYFLSMLFVLFIVAPTAIMLIEKSYDVSVFFSLSEEENTNEIEKNAHFSPNEIATLNTSSIFEKKTHYNGHSLNYKTFPLETISPPPEFMFI